jgi:signal transduction histidine kinase
VLRKLLHWTLLVITIILWLIAGWGVRKEKAGRKPEHIAAMVEQDLRRRVEQAGQLERRQAEFIKWLADSASATTEEWISELPFYLYVYYGDSLIAWNNSRTLPPAQIGERGRLYHLNNGTFYGYRQQKSWLPGSFRLSFLFPISEHYAISNEYLQPRFAASDVIDPDVPVRDTPVAGAVRLHAPDGHAIGWVYPPPPDDLPAPPSSWIVWCWLFSLFVFTIWLHGWISRVARNISVAWGIALVIIAAVGIRLALLWLGPPFSISETDLFSPRLYASSRLLSSLGDLLLHVLALLWILVFIAPRLRYGVVNGPLALRLSGGILSGIGLFGAGTLLVRLVRSLVLDSLIPFDMARLASLDGSSLAGLLIVSLMLSMLLIIAAIVRNALRALLPSFGWQALVLGISAIALWAIYHADALMPIYSVTALWLSIDILGQYIPNLREGARVFRVGNIFWSVAHCLLLALLVQQFSRIREIQVRKHFAEHIATRHDDAMEYNFGQSLTLIRTDTALQSFLRHPSPLHRSALDEQLAAAYFNNSLAEYQAQVFLYDAFDKPLFNSDTTSLARFVQVSETSIPSRTASDLFFREAATDDHIYLALLPIQDSLGNFLGSMAIDLEQKKTVSETVLPELLQPATINQAEKAAGYSYAIYAGGKLVAQTSDYPFPFYIAHDTASTPFYERKGKDFSTLIYSPDAYRTVYVWRRFGTLSQALTLFSYLLLFRFLLLALGAAYRQGRHWSGEPGELLRKWRGIGLRRRLHFSITGIVALSFIGIGVVTIIFLRQQYDNTSKARRQAMMQVVMRSIQQWMRERNADESVDLWRQATSSPDFRYFLSGLAGGQTIDINLFDANGRLTNTTQPAIFNQGLSAPVMRYSVLADFAMQPRSLITELEHIGTLRYQSCYAPLRTEGGQIAGYLNVPLFYAQRELEEQISSVVVTLINLYAVALLLSALLAFFITRWVTRAFDLIIRQFGRLNLHRNELLQWPYDDEVGVLVAEYNKMVRKVEESVALLARSEREGAFREMARQVAHEIKNPLTPMSLYVQRLQRAIQSGEPDAMDLARRVSDALIEQINNLSVIATEFGEFARIGSEKPEEIDLSAVVRNVIDPFAADGKTEIVYEIPEKPVYVRADRSQLVRIITNLMKNAIQAIPEERQGRIHVRLAEDKPDAVLSVEDNGSGIPAEVQEKLFTPYFTTKSSGTGLGLAMTRQMVEAWGGSIRFETEQGEGTTFFIRLPLMPAAADV